MADYGQEYYCGRCSPLSIKPKVSQEIASADFLPKLKVREVAGWESEGWPLTWSLAGLHHTPQGTWPLSFISHVCKCPLSLTLLLCIRACELSCFFHSRFFFQSITVSYFILLHFYILNPPCLRCCFVCSGAYITFTACHGHFSICYLVNCSIQTASQLYELGCYYVAHSAPVGTRTVHWYLMNRVPQVDWFIYPVMKPYCRRTA